MPLSSKKPSVGRIAGCDLVEVRDIVPTRNGTRGERHEDTAVLSLTPEDREQLGMDAWEPSLLRQLLSAQNRLKRRSG